MLESQGDAPPPLPSQGPPPLVSGSDVPQQSMDPNQQQQPQQQTATTTENKESGAKNACLFIVDNFRVLSVITALLILVFGILSFLYISTNIFVSVFLAIYLMFAIIIYFTFKL